MVHALTVFALIGICIIVAPAVFRLLFGLIAVAWYLLLWGALLGIWYYMFQLYEEVAALALFVCLIGVVFCIARAKILAFEQTEDGKNLRAMRGQSF